MGYDREVSHAELATTVLHVGGTHWGSQKLGIERALGSRPGVVAVAANPVAQTATVSYDPATTLKSRLSDEVAILRPHR